MDHPYGAITTPHCGCRLVMDSCPAFKPFAVRKRDVPTAEMYGAGGISAMYRSYR